MRILQHNSAGDVDSRVDGPSQLLQFTQDIMLPCVPGSCEAAKSGKHMADVSLQKPASGPQATADGLFVMQNQ